MVSTTLVVARDLTNAKHKATEDPQYIKLHDGHDTAKKQERKYSKREMYQ